MRRSMHRTLDRVFLVAVALLVAACDGQPPTTPGTNLSSQLIIVSGEDQSGIVGRELSEPLVVRALDDRGRPLRRELVNFVVTRGGGSVWAGAALTDRQGYARDHWTLGFSTEPEGNELEVRAVDPSNGEKLVFGTFVATGLPVPVGRVEVDPASAAIQVGETVQLSATVYSDVDEVLTDREVTWETSDESVATVSETGLVTGISGDGVTVEITATSEGVTGSGLVTLTGFPPDAYETYDCCSFFPFSLRYIGSPTAVDVDDAYFHDASDVRDGYSAIFVERVEHEEECNPDEPQSYEFGVGVGGLPFGTYTVNLYKDDDLDDSTGLSGRPPVASVTFEGTATGIREAFEGTCGIDDAIQFGVEILVESPVEFGDPYFVTMGVEAHF